jgi:hypothetical protein
MFKGILPSKRVVSAEFTMVTPLASVANGREKENAPDSLTILPVTSKPPRPAAARGLSQVFEKQKDKQTKAPKEKVQSKGEVPMDEAFDKLLVSKFWPSRWLSYIVIRMTFKFRQHYDPNW